MTNRKEKTPQCASVALGSLGPDELKSLVSSALVSMKIPEREDFVRSLEIEMRRANFDMRGYLVPLGIPGCSPEELTPTEIGHLIRFLKMVVPKAMSAVEHVAARYGAFAKKMAESGGRLAA
jgi:hypothetical protein